MVVVWWNNHLDPSVSRAALCLVPPLSSSNIVLLRRARMQTYLPQRKQMATNIGHTRSPGDQFARFFGGGSVRFVHSLDQLLLLLL